MTFVPTSEFLSILVARGFVAQCTDMQALDTALSKGSVVGYVGYDATAPSLHVGHLVNLMMLRWFQKTGHQPITLIGGGTTKVGDPSFRAAERPMLDAQAIAANASGISQPFAQILDFAPGQARMRNNADWLDGLNLLDFLRDTGQHFSVNRMLSFESVKSRLDRQNPLTFLEFTYMLLQAFDFLQLHQQEGCMLQMGGSDQWGNIVNGIDLTRRVAGSTVWGLTSPLLAKSNGEKMGKSAGGAVWLNAGLCSPAHFWQFWRNVDDADVGRFLRLFTELPLDVCDSLAALQGSEKNLAKTTLANHATALVHGERAAQEAHALARAVFDEGTSTAALDVSTLPKETIGEGITLAQILVGTGMVASGKEAKRAIQAGSVRVGNTPVNDAHQRFDALAFGDGLKVSVGKKHHRLVRLA